MLDQRKYKSETNNISGLAYPLLLIFQVLGIQRFFTGQSVLSLGLHLACRLYSLLIPIIDNYIQTIIFQLQWKSYTNKLTSMQTQKQNLMDIVKKKYSWTDVMVNYNLIHLFNR
jgi:hypothetical protein